MSPRPAYVPAAMMECAPSLDGARTCMTRARQPLSPPATGSTVPVM
ncbi:hypothetical protein FOC27_24525 [Burkholderia multivorans]|nr:hypothetical protein FOC27_24525 [Burkholderia multivorans]QGR83852.1 hypothetical protein FOC34_01235 [Burkholderia multivorans]